MSNFVVFDSQNQRWMIPRGTPGTQKLKAHHQGRATAGCLHRGAACLVLTISLVALAFFTWLGEAFPLSPPAAIGLVGIPTFGFCLRAVIIRASMNQETTKTIENYVKERGWADFEPTKPDEGLPCFVVNYKDPSIV